MDEIVLVGYPRGIGKTIRYGHIITKKSWIAPWIGNFPIDTYQISTPAYPGNSGSPLVNKRGEVVGVLFAGHPYYPLEPFMVPLEAIQSFLLLNAK
jgi:S1-C subfamily serine protease